MSDRARKVASAMHLSSMSGSLLSLMSVAWGVWIVSPWVSVATASGYPDGRVFKESVLGWVFLCVGLAGLLSPAFAKKRVETWAHTLMASLWTLAMVLIAMIDWHSIAMPTAAVLAVAQWVHVYGWALESARQAERARVGLL